MARKSSAVTLALLFIPLLLIYCVTVVFLERLHHTADRETLEVAVRSIRSNSNELYHINRVANSDEDDNDDDDHKDEVIDCSEQLLFGTFNGITLNGINKEEIEFSIQQECLNGKEKCQTPMFSGPLKINIDTSIDVYNRKLNYVNFGGWWSPTYCLKQTKKVAVVIPHNSEDKDHLGILLNHLHPILRKQQLHYRIFVVKHKNQNKFCKGKLMNAGFLEIDRLFPYTCFVFHDVDLLPLDDRIDYSCKNSPMQLSVLIDDLKNNVKSKNLFGRVVSFKPKDYKGLEGFPNTFCSNDDETLLYRHIANKKLKPTKESFDRGRFTMLRHHTYNLTNSKHRLHMQKPSPWRRHSSQTSYSDKGLKSTPYKTHKIEKRHHYTLITIDDLDSSESDIL